MEIIDDPCGYAMADVRRYRGYGSLLWIQCQRDAPLVVEPPITVEALFQLRRAPPVTTRVGASVEYPTEYGHQLLRRKPVALKLARAKGRRNGRAILVDDRVAAILPSLVLRAFR